MRGLILLENGSRKDACIAFDKAKEGVSDFTKETIVIFGNVRNPKEGWSVVKTYK